MAGAEASAGADAEAEAEGGGVPRRLYGLFVVLFLEIWGAAMTIPVFQYFCMQQLGLKATSVGIIMSCFNGAQLLGAPVVGRISDAFGRRLALLGCFTWTAVCFLVTAGVNSFVELLVVRTAAGLSGGSIPVTQAMVMDTTSPQQRPKVLGAMGGLLGLAFTMGPAVSVFALAMGSFDRRWIFVAAAVLAFVGCVVGAFILEETLPEEKRRPLMQEREKCVAELEEAPSSSGGSGTLAASSGLVAFTREFRGVLSPAMVCIWVGRFCSAFAYLCLFSTYAFLIRDAFGWKDVQFGMLLALSGITSAISQFVLYPRASAALGKHAVFVVGSAFVAAFFAILPYTTLRHRYVVIHLTSKLLLFSIGASLMEGGVPDLVGFHAHEDRMGFAQGLTTAFRSMASVLAPLIAGRLYDASPYIVYLMAAALAAIGGVAVACAPLLPTAREDGETQRLVSK